MSNVNILKLFWSPQAINS